MTTRGSSAAYTRRGGEHDSCEGRWTSLEAQGLYEHKSAARALYRAVLRGEVRERLPRGALRCLSADRSQTAYGTVVSPASTRAACWRPR
jgi:hypothetical protein